MLCCVLYSLLLYSIFSLGGESFYMSYIASNKSIMYICFHFCVHSMSGYTCNEMCTGFIQKKKRPTYPTFRSYLRCTVRRWLNTFRVTTMYVSTPSTVSLYMPRNWGSSVLPWHSTINWRQSGEERESVTRSVGVRDQIYSMKTD